MKSFIYQNPDSLTPEFCIKVIDLFEKSKQYQYQEDMGKKCIDDLSRKALSITKCGEQEWIDIKQHLIKELEKHIFLWSNKLDPENNIFMLEKVHKKKSYMDFLLRKYEKNIGNFTYHNDYDFDHKTNKCRILNYLWYLNDVAEGGETEFFGNYIIKPKQGQIILFPSDWTFPHTEKIPISNDKYIIAGWVYIDKD